MRSFIVFLSVFSLISCDTGSDTPKSETGQVTTDSGDVPSDTNNQTGPQDRDGDGFYDDCDDDNDAIYPGAVEFCDGLDNDCNGVIDDNALDATPWYLDADGDGYGDSLEESLACEAPTDHVSNASDCNDADATFHPGATEADCTDSNDYNCDGSVGYVDDDGDGHAACEDCDDTEAGVHESQPEICDGLDNDCNGFVDSDDPNLVDGTTWYADVDGDGHGADHFVTQACEQPDGYVDNSDDCDDLEPLSYPSAAEVCDEKDNDCDGDIDEGVGFTWYADVDGDGYGDASSVVTSCDAPQGYSANGNDCDDTAPNAHPGGVEVCNDIDDDCDGTVDGPTALNATSFYADTDSDGYGDATSSVTACDAPSNHVENDSDCDDTSAANNPAADEVCDGADNNCDGSVDEASATDASTWYADADNDTYGNAAISQVACAAPSGHVADSSDCDDTSNTTNPGATETCNDVDDNCDGTTDEGLLSTFYADVDNDGYGSASVSQQACTAPVAYVSDNTDCNDVNASVRPGGTEVCDANNEDEDCDTFADDNDPEGASGTTLYYPDADSDGYGDTSDTGTAWCDPPTGMVSDNSDCDDSATGSSTYPGAAEVCDAVDADCDGNLDDPGQDDCHTLASCTDPGTGYTCVCEPGYISDGANSCVADPFPGSTLLDSTQKAQLSTWANTSGQVWTLCYRKSRDGGSASTFHSQCNGYSNTFSVANLSTGKLIGGYADSSWSGSGYSGSTNNFLFSLTEGYRIGAATGQHGTSNHQYNHSSYGPTFGGGHDWYVDSSMNGGYCNLGHDYACQVGSYGNDSCRNDFCGNYSSWSVNEFEVWGR